MDLASLFKEEDYNFFSNVLATTNGQSLLDAKLQEVWDENVSDKYKGITLQLLELELWQISMVT